MMYHVVIKTWGTGRAWYSRPYNATEDETTARAQYTEAKRDHPQSAEVVVLTAPTYGDLCIEYDQYIAGRPFHQVVVDVDGVREQWEMAPLRAEYPDPPHIRFSRFPWPERELRGYIRLMARVWRGELGGPDDGAE